MYLVLMENFLSISGQSVDPNKEKIGAKLDKDFRTKQLIRDALMDNDFLKNLSSGQIREVIDFMQVKKIAAGTYVSNKVIHWALTTKIYGLIFHKS